MDIPGTNEHQNSSSFLTKYYVTVSLNLRATSGQDFDIFEVDKWSFWLLLRLNRSTSVNTSFSLFLFSEVLGVAEYEYKV